MDHQSEAILEYNLIKQLIGLSHGSVKIHDGDTFVTNQKTQLEPFNKTTFIVKFMNKYDIFDTELQYFKYNINL